MTHGATMGTAVIRPLQRPVPLRQSVYDALIDLIVNGDLPPGQHMVETDLARQLGVSRQPIREALHRMEAEGWVDLRPSQGAFVHVPTEQEVDELLGVLGDGAVCLSLGDLCVGYPARPVEERDRPVGRDRRK